MYPSSEKEKFIHLIKEHKGLLYKVIYSYCADPEDRKDLEQEIIIQLWKSRKNYNREYKISTWIYRIALNVAISFYRSDVKRKEKSESFSERVLEIADTCDLVEEKNSRTALLYRFINQLDDFNKAIIILHLEENSHQEIAEILGITVSNVGTKISRIKKKLRESFSLVND